MNCYSYKSSLILTFRYYPQLFDIIRRILGTLFLRARRCFLLIVNVFCVIAIIIIIISKVFSQHLYLSNVFRGSDLYHSRNLLIVWNDLTRRSRSRLYASRTYLKCSLNNVFGRSDLYYYRNLPAVWNDLVRFCNNHIYLEAFLSIETLLSHIFFDL